MSIIKKSFMNSSSKQTLVPNNDLLFFHESGLLGAPYHKENINLYYVMGSSSSYSSSISNVSKNTNTVSLSVTHAHYVGTDIGGGTTYLSEGGYGKMAVKPSQSVTAQYAHYHTFGVNLTYSNQLKKAIKLYLYTANTGNELPTGAIVLSDKEDISGCTKMGDNTDQFLYITSSSSTPNGTDGIGLSTNSISWHHLQETYYSNSHDHRLGVSSGSNESYYYSATVSANRLFSSHSHGNINGALKIDPNTIILRLFKYNNPGPIKEGMIVGSRDANAFNGTNGWYLCDGTNNTPNLSDRCPVINNSKPINETHNTSLSDFVVITGGATNTQDPNVLDHTSDHVNALLSSSNYANGTDGFVLYDANSSIIVNSSLTSHNHTLSDYTGKALFGSIIFFKFSG